VNSISNINNILNINPQETTNDIIQTPLMNASNPSISKMVLHVNPSELSNQQQSSTCLNTQLNLNLNTSTNNVNKSNSNMIFINQPQYNKLNTSTQHNMSNNNNGSLNNTNGAGINTSGVGLSQIENSVGNKSGNSNLLENTNVNSNTNHNMSNPYGVLHHPNIGHSLNSSGAPANTNSGLLLRPNIGLSPSRDLLLKHQQPNQPQPNNTNAFVMKDLLSKIDMLSLQQQQNKIQPNPPQLAQNAFSPLQMPPNLNQQQQQPIPPPTSTASTMYSQTNSTFNSFPYDLSQISSTQGNSSTQLGNDIIENCISVCKEQAGCRILQKKLDENPQIAVDVIYPKIRDHIKELSNDQFGNYFVQKIIEYITNEQLEDLLTNKIATIFRELSLNQHGTRVIQKIFEKIINNEQLLSFFKLILTPNLKDFIVDANATHIIIKYVSLIQSPGNDFIIEFLAKNIYEIATQKHSCCSLQKCIEFSNPQQKRYLLLAVANNSYGLFMDQFGNYVVQFAVSACDYEINRIIVINFLRDFQKFSSQKYSSNVIEKSLDCCDDETKQMIVEKLCEQKLVSSLLFDMYGNYVLQKTMMLAKEPYRMKFIQMVGPYLENLKVLTFGQKLYNKLLVSFPELAVYAKTNTISNSMNNYKKRNKKQKISQPQLTPNQNQANPIGMQGMNPQMNMFMQQNSNMMMNQTPQNSNMKPNNMNNNMNNNNNNPYNNYNNMFFQNQNQFYGNSFPSNNNFMSMPLPQNQLKNKNGFNMQNNFGGGNGMPPQNYMQQNSYVLQNPNEPPSMFYKQPNHNMPGGNFMHNNYYN
jgi:hypothetical protein